jgi:hypothetical protein
VIGENKRRQSVLLQSEQCGDGRSSSGGIDTVVEKIA